MRVLVGGLGTRKLILASAACLVAAGCLPVGPPPPPPLATQACGLSFSSASAYQNDFHTLAHANTGWIHADGYVPAPLPDGRTAWWMSDTGTGSVNPDNSAPDAGTVHNSLVSQDASCLTPKLGGSAHAWTDLIPAPAGKWYWPGSTVVEGNTLLVFAYVVAPASGPAGFDWTILGTAVARYSLPGLTLQNVTNLPVQNTPAVVYGGGAIPWGIRTVDLNGTVYLYGATRRSDLGPGDVWVARAPFGQVSDAGAWEYYTGLPAPLDWNSQSTLAQPMTFTGTPQQNQDDIKAPLAQLSVYHYGTKYLASSLSNVLDTRVRAWISDNPEGPWQYLGVVATAQFLNSEQVAYDARVVDLPGAGWTAVYSVNDPNHNKQDIRLYRGQFATPTSGVLPPP